MVLILRRAARPVSKDARLFNRLFAGYRPVKRFTARKYRL